MSNRHTHWNMGNLIALACDSWHSKFRFVRTVAPISIFRLTCLTVQIVKLRPGLVPTAINKIRSDGTVPACRQGALFRTTCWCSVSNAFRRAGTGHQSCAQTRDTALTQRTIGLFTSFMFTRCHQPNQQMAPQDFTVAGGQDRLFRQFPFAINNPKRQQAENKRNMTMRRGCDQSTSSEKRSI